METSPTFLLIQRSDSIALCCRITKAELKEVLHILRNITGKQGYGVATSSQGSQSSSSQLGQASTLEADVDFLKQEHQALQAELEQLHRDKQESERRELEQVCEHTM